MFDVAKVIRVLGYIAYASLWSPVIVVCLVVMPVVWLVMMVRIGMTVKEAFALYNKAMKASIQHDVNFIRTGVW